MVSGEGWERGGASELWGAGELWRSNSLCSGDLHRNSCFIPQSEVGLAARCCDPLLYPLPLSAAWQERLYRNHKGYFFCSEVGREVMGEERRLQSALTECTFL